MITSVELSNFLSHKNSEIKFDHGVTVILGHNGAGKSSIMDAIIFSMFGANRRDSIEKLQKEGENQTYAKTSFEINGKVFQAIRKIQNGSTKTHELTDESGSLITKSATETENRIRELIELDYNELRIASIVPADELTRIINVGSELRSLIDKMMGAEKYSKLESLLKEAIKNFRMELQEKHGYTYENLTPLQKVIDQAEDQIKKCDEAITRVNSDFEKVQKGKEELEKRIQDHKKNADSKNEYQKVKSDFIRHVKNVIMQKRSEYEKENERITRCNNQFPIAEKKEYFKRELEVCENKINMRQKVIQELNSDMSSLIEQEKLAKKLQLTNGKCPVCDTKVKQLNPIFQEEHLKIKREEKERKLVEIETEQKLLNDSKTKNKKNYDDANTATIILNENGISNKVQLNNIKKLVEEQHKEITSFEKMFELEQFQQISTIDSTSTSMYHNLVELEKKSKEFDEKNFQNLELVLEDVKKRYTGIIRELGVWKARSESSKNAIEKLMPIVNELKLAKEYVENIEKINYEVFSTQSKTFTGLRYFALRKISDRASTYLEILKTQVQRVNLFQDKASVKIDCETVSGIRPVKNLSSGEQACVALSIRLAMAEIMTKSPLRVMILDEPTAHLDQEHCELFLDALQQLTDQLNQNQNFQFIISTHQEDLWANSKIGTIYKLENPTGKNTIIEKF